ncbi:3-hydroxyacyl-CoA dehydrogenase/3-hydroxy-2-methylbutyryl-CoA dehydrogenase [Bradyrhizobium diazoefficiens]
MQITDCVALITGGASGIGEACAEYLLGRGAKGVTLLDVNAEVGRSVAARLGDRALFVRTDITDLAAVENAVAAAEREFGPVSAIINAAGVTLPAKLIGKNGPIAMEKFDAAIRVNLYGTLHVIRSAVPSMLNVAPNEDGERGVIINVASGAAYEGQIGQIGYSAAKAGVIGMTMPLFRELASHGIRVVAVAPGAFDTPIYGTMPAEVKAGIERTFLFPKRMGRPQEFALFVEEIIRNPMHNGRNYRFDAGNILTP